MSAQGSVHLVGAGPGDPGLISVRGRELLETADVVVYDRLVHRGLLGFCRADCLQICVGKRAGGPSVTQEEIEAELVKHARAGRRVVRLKGGDPFVFGRGGEEATHLAAAGIGFEIVPGITSALGAGAFAGIPLTNRDVASTLVFATGHESQEKPRVAVDWRALGALRHATLCLYMAMAHLDEIARELQAGGLTADTPAACIQWASLGRQRTVVATLGTLAAQVAKAGLAAPTIVVIGEVVRLRETVAWFEKRPLLGRRIVVTRNREQAGELSARLEAVGASVLELPLVRVSPVVDKDLWAEVFPELGSYDWLVFTSANGVRHFFDAFFKVFPDLRALGVMRIACVGEATAAAVRALHLEVEITPEKAVAEELAKLLIDTGSLDSAKVLVVTGNQNRDVLVKKLEEARAIVDCFMAYKTEQADLSDEPAAVDFREHGADAVIFTSSSGVRSYVDQAPALQLSDTAKRPLLGSIGPITSDALRAAKLPVDFEAKSSSLDVLVAAVVKALGKA
ncbi:MAG: uroporphyrinogen-III C-methyltransferase [Opitutaceae bacterium]|nr:uroporphyrinogen-III C-methyltransferase [Opitutaceae bacterium]